MPHGYIVTPDKFFRHGIVHLSDFGGSWEILGSKNSTDVV